MPCEDLASCPLARRVRLCSKSLRAECRCNPKFVDRLDQDADIVAQDLGHNFVDLGYRGLGPDSPAELGLDHGRGKSVDIPEQMDGSRCCTGVSKCNMSTN